MEKHFLGSLLLIEKLVKCDKREWNVSSEAHNVTVSREGRKHKQKSKKLEKRKTFFASSKGRKVVKRNKLMME
jgi:hypothetical protein